MTKRHLTTHCLGMAAVIVALAACSPLPIATTPTEPQNLPVLTWPNGKHYTIDPTRSEFRVQLSAEGPLARFGHPHVIGTRTIEGSVVVPDDWQETVFQLSFDIDDLLVDPPRWREQAGLTPDIPLEDIEATRQNMRSASQLNAATFPAIELQSARIEGTPHQPTITVWVSLAGQISQQALPATIHWGLGHSPDQPADELIISGRASWRLSDLGITPFSVFGGGLRVGDEIELRVRLYAVSGNDQSMAD